MVSYASWVIIAWEVYFERKIRHMLAVRKEDSISLKLHAYETFINLNNEWGEIKGEKCIQYYRFSPDWPGPKPELNFLIFYFPLITLNNGDVFVWCITSLWATYHPLPSSGQWCRKYLHCHGETQGSRVLWICPMGGSSCFYFKHGLVSHCTWSNKVEQFILPKVFSKIHTPTLEISWYE
jgi:hypothetical protein